MNDAPTDMILSPWARISEHCFVHRSGACIERRGYPSAVPGWYLVPDPRGESSRRFEPTPQGCDDAFIAFGVGYPQ
ncbi:MAG TPA: hypothetical protein VG457_04905 [Planctomycetota bacterium]|jgi:hypothetical protein|nr:hypothetical protein [Planctomycetota bacterium]